MARVFLPFIVLLLIVTVGLKVYNLIKPLNAPPIDVNEFWGAGNSDEYRENTAIRPQEIYYSQAQIDRLRTKLNESINFTPALEGTFDEYGINTKELKGIVKYWRDEYLTRWERRQEFLNQYPHFLTEIQGMDIHFIHKKPSEYETKDKQVLPLLLLHGWPGSVREFYELIPLLSSPRNDSGVIFEVVIPSLPGFGWSEAASKPGLGVLEMAVVLRNLMLRLGHEKFYVQGGDLGSMLGSAVATLFPDKVFGFHSNLCALFTPLSIIKGAMASVYPSIFIDAKYASFVFPIRDKWTHLMRETGFLHLQATKPDTIGAVLADNPIGLAAYILEKYSHFFIVLTKEAVLDNLTIYALTNSITTSVRLYAEAFSARHLAYNLQRIPTSVPVGCARFQKDIGHTLDWQLRDKYPNLIQSTYHALGGHFAAMEVPEALHNEIRQFVEKVESLRFE